MIAKIVAWLLRQRKLTVQDRQLLTTAVLTGIDAVPLRPIIQLDESFKILVNGRQIDPLEGVSIRESASSALSNKALAIIREQVRFAAIQNGFLNNETGDPLRELFYKAALWYIQEEKNLLESVADQHSTL